MPSVGSIPCKSQLLRTATGTEAKWSSLQITLSARCTLIGAYTRTNTARRIHLQAGSRKQVTTTTPTATRTSRIMSVRKQQLHQQRQLLEQLNCTGSRPRNLSSSGGARAGGKRPPSQHVKSGNGSALGGKEGGVGRGIHERVVPVSEGMGGGSAGQATAGAGVVARRGSWPYGLKPIDYANASESAFPRWPLPPHPPPPTNPLRRHLPTAAILSGVSFMVWLYFNRDDSVYEYWRQVEQGNVPLPDDLNLKRPGSAGAAEGDDDDDDDWEDDDDYDEWEEDEEKEDKVQSSKGK